MVEVVPLTPFAWMLRFPVVNAYVLRLTNGFALIDTGPRGFEAEILGVLDGIAERRADLHHILLTHSHKDHAGSAAALVELRGATVLAGSADAPIIAGDAFEPEALITDEERPFYEKIAPTIPPAPPVPVDRLLHDGDDLDWGEPEAVVVEVPGHTAGSISLHLPAERMLFTGDNVASLSGRAVLGPFNVDRGRAIASFQHLASLDVDLVCFGHGDPIRTHAGEALRRSAARL
jgi:glyoxylase-like metal-dependent hydrolase (beta-lactamase superfamily II)